MAKKKEVSEIKEEKKKNYKGAEWTGAEFESAEFGQLQKGKIYPLSEERAKISDGFKPIYEAEITKGEK